MGGGRFVIVALLAASVAGCAKPARIYKYDEVTFLPTQGGGFGALEQYPRQYPANATLLCMIGEAGDLRDCKVESIRSEAPPNMRNTLEQGFLLNAGTVRVAPKGKDGSDARGQQLRFEIRYAVGE